MATQGITLSLRVDSWHARTHGDKVCDTAVAVIVACCALCRPRRCYRYLRGGCACRSPRWCKICCYCGCFRCRPCLCRCCRLCCCCVCCWGCWRCRCNPFLVEPWRLPLPRFLLILVAPGAVLEQQLQQHRGQQYRLRLEQGQKTSAIAAQPAAMNSIVSSKGWFNKCLGVWRPSLRKGQ